MTRTTADEAPHGWYDVVMAVFVGLLLISGVTATKLFEGPVVPWFSRVFYGGGPLVFDGGAFLFPLSYVVGDIMTEVYGWRRAKRAIWTGLAMTFLAAITYWVVSLTTPVEGFEAWDGVLAPVGRITIAGLAGFLAGQLLNSLVLVRIKRRMAARGVPEQGVATRLVTSTLVGELVDTLLFCSIAFAGTISLADLTNYTVTGYLYKCLVEICVVPLTMLIIRHLKRIEPGYRPGRI